MHDDCDEASLPAPERLMLALMNDNSGEVRVAVGFRDCNGETQRLFSVLRRDRAALKRLFDFLVQEIVPEKKREQSYVSGDSAERG